MALRTATAHLRSVSPYSQSRHIDEPRGDKESPDDHERRCWRHRIHADKDGNVYIPPMALKGCLAEAAGFLGEKIKGRGNATWRNRFRAGVLVVDPAYLGIKADDVRGEWLHLDATGRPGGGSRVMRCMPRIDEWETKATFFVTDDSITPDLFEKYLSEAGKFIGIGRFRPLPKGQSNGGYYGRFEVVDVKWS